GAAERRRFIGWQQAKFLVEQRPPLELDLTPEELVEATAGLTLTGIRHLFLKAQESEARKLSRAFVVQKKRELIERDSRGMLSVIDSKHGLDAVGGHDMIKSFLSQTAEDLRAGRSDVPVGIVCPGPNGVGKTFIAKAFAKDAGVNAVMLRNFRGMYVGQTEGNLDIIFNILKAMTPNIVVIDEADKMLGNEQTSEGNKVDDRVFGAFTAFMGDPEYRGRIFWLLLTARPFNLAPDTGRPGRVEEHVPILGPESYEDKLAILSAVLKLRKMTLEADSGGDPSQADYEALFAELGFVTPAALELVANRARRSVRRKLGGDPATVSVPLSVFRDEARAFVPEGSLAKLQLQTIEAVLYTNHLSYLPEPWRSRLRDDPNGLTREREALRRLVGYA
ncbi:MAG TPA: ATP-binding protein, partial [Polyangiaceae bacterium]|nr:ATP-binding protein [Polyangiaceae bacterium]